ncbi:LPXTG cell wall anchor domain-containing protein [Micromonospora sp. NPDC003944]
MLYRRLLAIPVAGRLGLVALVVLAAALLAPGAPNAAGQPSGRVAAAPSAGTGVTFEVRPAPTTAPPTQPPTARPTETARPQPPTRSPQHGGKLPVTGVGPSVLVLALLGAALVVGGVLLRRRRSAG